ncbi:hypothetical protein FISHEDRAFT_69460 [Fistulina hepatica ATCC 64428]|uniref:Uncharacterized protein n=1 Tax=Fistulina hepatica ATCC 64428 TaxID=1128425 RepID=A0A0D7AMA9_9AGAR|nr:hypothetical protein FISHEDRAFT_69460 [Fistulina hepatica ATCC 64428]
MLFIVSLVTFVVVLVLMAYKYRDNIIHYLPEVIRSRVTFPRYTRLTTFSAQAGAGLTSSAFDIEANIRDGDSRMGLDERDTQEVADIMRQERVTFDQARLIRQNRLLTSNNIDSSGMPLDSKAITHL